MPRLFLTIDTELMPLLLVLKGQNRKDAFPTLSGAEEGGGGQDAASPVSSGVVPPAAGRAALTSETTRPEPEPLSRASAPARSEEQPVLRRSQCTADTHSRQDAEHYVAGGGGREGGVSRLPSPARQHGRVPSSDPTRLTRLLLSGGHRGGLFERNPRDPRHSSSLPVPPSLIVTTAILCLPIRDVDGAHGVARLVGAHLLPGLAKPAQVGQQSRC